VRRSLPEVFEISDIEFDRESVRREGLREFVRLAWHLVEPATRFVWGWHIDVICEHLEALWRCEINDLVINMPPRHMKSLTVAVFFPAFLWTRAPAERLLFSSYAEKLSIRDSVKTRRIIESPWYQARWGHLFTLLSDQNQKIKFENDQGGYRLATSVDGSNTGEGGDIIVVDDAHNVNDRESKLAREGVIDWWDNVMSTRSNNPKRRRRLIMGQRVHERDLPQVVVEKGGWYHLSLPAEYEDGKCPIKQCTHHWSKDPRTTPGELLWEGQFGRAELDKLKEDLGPVGTASQLQQRPAPLEGNLCKKSWLRYFTSESVNQQVYYLLHTPTETIRISKAECSIFFTIDLAASTKTSADLTVVSVWAAIRRMGVLLWLDTVGERMEGPDQQDLIWKMNQTWKPSLIGVESTAYQLTLFQTMIRSGLPGHKLNADKDKVSRFIPAGNAYKNGLIYHPAHAPWLGEVEGQLLTFPEAGHDDYVDTCSYAVHMLQLFLGAGEIPMEGH